REPVLRLAGEPVPALEQENPLARRRETAHECPPSCAATDHDHVVVAHANSASVSSTMIRAAASIKARCENACGKFPRWRPVLLSNSSAYRPSGEATLRSFSIRS